MNQTRHDTLNFSTVVNDSSEFQIIVVPDSIKYSWPIHAGTKTISVPNNFYVKAYPVEIADGYGTISKYDDNGPIYYHFIRNSLYSMSYEETFTLIQFINP